MKRLKVLQIFSRYLYQGGEESSVFRIGDALQDHHEVEYFLGSTQEMLGDSFFDKVSTPFRAFYNLPVAQRLRQYQELGQFDLWQVHNVIPALSPSVYQAAFSLRVPVVHYLHNYRMSCTNGFFLNHGQPCERCLHGNFWPALQTACWRNSHLISGMMGLILRRIRSLGTFRKIKAWVALSQAQRAKHIEIGIPSDLLHVVPHFYEPKGEPLPPCPLGNVLFLGRLSPEKGVDYLLRAWKLVKPSSRKLLIAGEGPEEPKLRKLAADLGLANVEFTGFLNSEQQRSVWAASAFSVVPSIWNEPFGMVLLEAWSHSRPAVCFAHGSFPELVREGQDGLLAEPFSAPSLASKIQEMIDAPARVMEMGAIGKSRILGEFNRHIWMERIEAVYQKALFP